MYADLNGWRVNSGTVPGNMRERGLTKDLKSSGYNIPSLAAVSSMVGIRGFKKLSGQTSCARVLQDLAGQEEPGVKLRGAHQQ